MCPLNSIDNGIYKKLYLTLDSIAKIAKFSDGAEAARNGILALWRFREENTRKIAEVSGLPVPGISALRKELFRQGLFKNLKEFSSQGIEWVENNLKLINIPEIPLFYDPMRESLIAKFFSELCLKEIKNISKKRPHPNPDYDQSRINFETIIKRIKALLSHGDLEGRRLCFLGDDDGMSIALAIFKRFNPSFNYTISVIDIDELVLNYVRKYDLEKEISMLKMDLRGKIPKSWLNIYDVIMTDPPYTIVGARLFLRKAYSLLHQNINYNQTEINFKPIYFSFSNKPTIFTSKLTKMILEESFSIDSYYKRFNFYSGERLIHRYSNLWFLKSLPREIEKSSINQEFNRIYTWQMIEGGLPRNKRKK
ncbi:MAG: N(4)-bis(aminopropyl)spermidine synthase [Candidatus Heimdallarchaeota archaeon LC_3]|nr:MAG: N(4)-bis(aminopropyl)spermidine synthase [Candidatus Heimdallarchaeota archaeon LC_3]